MAHIHVSILLETKIYVMWRGGAPAFLLSSLLRIASSAPKPWWVWIPPILQRRQGEVSAKVRQSALCKLKKLVWFLDDSYR